MKTIYRLFGVAVLGAMLALSAGTATAADEVVDPGDERINDALYEWIDAS